MSVVEVYFFFKFRLDFLPIFFDSLSALLFTMWSHCPCENEIDEDLRMFFLLPCQFLHAYYMFDYFSRTSRQPFDHILNLTKRLTLKSLVYADLFLINFYANMTISRASQMSLDIMG